MSTFYRNGFNDAINGIVASPPDPRKNYRGQVTNVYGNEYMEGYNDGLKQILKQGVENE
jgi:hypothetical protein